MKKIQATSWHFKVYCWFREYQLPTTIDLCSYCRTVMFWAPLWGLILIFCRPWDALYKRNRTLAVLLPSVLSLALFILIGVLISYSLAMVILVITAVSLLTIDEILRGRLKERAVNGFDGFTETKTAKLISDAFEFLCRPGIKIFEVNPALGFILVLVTIAALTILSNSWLYVLIVLGGQIGFMVLVIIVILLIEMFKALFKNDSDSYFVLIWHWIKAQKNKVCPILKIERG